MSESLKRAAIGLVVVAVIGLVPMIVLAAPGSNAGGGTDSGTGTCH